MAKRKTVITEKDDVLEVKSTWDEDFANELLATKQWILLHGSIAHADSGGFQAKPLWMLGRIK